MASTSRDEEAISAWKKAFELFNAFNGATNLNRYINLSSSSRGRLEEIMAPRIGLFVVRVRF